MIYHMASSLATKSIVWTVTDLESGASISGVPAYELPRATAQLKNALAKSA